MSAQRAIETGRRICRPTSQLEDLTMMISQSRWLGLLACVVVLTATSLPTGAQIQQSAARDAAIRRCIEEAQRLYPGPSQGTDRSDYYTACMTNAGFAP
jgi:hypothetical protein